MGTTYKLNRLWNIFNTHAQITLAAYLAVMMVYAVVKLAQKSFRPAVDLGTMAIVLLIIECYILLRQPKKLTVLGKDLLFTKVLYIEPRILFAHIHGLGHLKVHFHVSNLQNLTFYQTRLEKVFDMGHITFSGDTNFEAKRDMDRIRVPDTLRIYGIRNFTEFKKHFEE